MEENSYSYIIVYILLIIESSLTSFILVYAALSKANACYIVLITK